MTTANQVATAVLTEHFRYTPLTLLDEIINAVNEVVFRAVNAIEAGLHEVSAPALGFTLSEAQQQADFSDEQRSSALEDIKEAEVAGGIVQLESLLNATVDRDFDKLEIYTLRNILAIGREEEGLAPWVRLEHYRNVPLPSSTTHQSHSEQSVTPEQIQLARRKLHETAKLNAMLRAEEAQNAAVLSQLSALLGSPTSTTDAHIVSDAPLSFLTSSPSAALPTPAPSSPLAAPEQQQPLTSSVNSALDQLPAMRALLTRVKDTLAALPQSRKATRRYASERTEAHRQHYVESRSRKALERRGLSAEGEMGSALASIGGRFGVSEEAVQNLEEVLKIMGTDMSQNNGDSGRTKPDDAEMDIDD